MMPRFLREFFLSPERHEVSPERVERGHERGQQRDTQDDRIITAMLGSLRRGREHREDFVLAPEAGQQRHPGQRQCTCQEC